MRSPIIGQAVPRKEGRAKITGRAQYVADVTLPDQLHGVTVRSPIARGKIRGIHFEAGVPWEEFVVVTAKDIPARNSVVASRRRPAVPCGRCCESSRGSRSCSWPTRINICWRRRGGRCGIEIEPLPAIFRDRGFAGAARRSSGAGIIYSSHSSVEKGDVDAAWR